MKVSKFASSQFITILLLFLVGIKFIRINLYCKKGIVLSNEKLMNKMCDL